MERRGKEDDLQRFMSQNPTAPSSENLFHASMLENHIFNGNPFQNPSSENYFFQNPSLENQFYETPTLQNQFYPNPTLQNHFYQNPATENGRSNSLMPENNLWYQNQYGSMGSFGSGLHLYPSLTETLNDQELETCFSRLNLSTPPRGVQLRGNSLFADSSVSEGFPHLSYPQDQKINMDLQSMRIQNAVRGQMGYHMRTHNVPYMGNEGLGVLGLPRSSSTAYADYQLGNQRNGTQSLAAAMNRSATTCSNINDEFFLPRRNQSSDSSSYDYPVRSSSSRNGIRLASNFQHRGRSLNGLDSENSNLLSSLYDHQRSGQRPNYSSLEEIRGQVSVVARDQHGCRFLQNKFEEGKPEEVEMIFSEVSDHLHELMVNQFGNFLIQKLVEVCNEEQISKILLSVISNEQRLVDICVDTHGTRAMQKLMEHLTTPDQKSLVVSVLRRITVTLTKSLNGHHVIQHCFKFFSNEDTKHLLNEVAENCLDIATDKSGCCVLQQCVAHAKGAPRERLVAEITANALVLSEHPYGNYVLQYILGLGIPHVTDHILAQLAGNIVTLSMNKYGSNVVEKCLKESGEQHSTRIINEIMNSPNFLSVVLDPYGNYVVQSALVISKGFQQGYQHDNLADLVQSKYAFIHSHPHGKRVLARAKGSRHRV